MEGAVDHAQLTFDTTTVESLRVCDVFVKEQVKRTDADPRRRKPRQIGAPGRNGIRGDRIRSNRALEIGLPTEPIVFGCPDHWSCRGTFGAQSRSVIQHRVHQQLEDRANLTAIIRKLSKAGCQPAARAYAANRDPVGINQETRGVGADPLHRRITVIECRGIRRVGGQPVLDGHNHDPQLFHEPPQTRIVHSRVANDESSAMHPHQDRRRLRDALGVIDP